MGEKRREGGWVLRKILSSVLDIFRLMVFFVVVCLFGGV